MIPELGHFALILALVLAIVQVSVPLIASRYEHNYYMRLAFYTARGQCLFVGLSFVALAYAFLTNDFSVAYVAENSNSHLPWIYQFCAIWGAHEGSLLLWVFILSLWGAAVSIFNRSLPVVLVARVLAVLAAIAIGFYLLMLMTSDPFLRLLPNIPVEGNDLNPLLQDPGLVSHPPMLYMGYVGFSVAFAFAIAALISGRLDAAWARWTRPWTIIAWSFLTLGIVLGSWWAYRELGWGGWWFWDPVENASFLPWLAGTALIHSLIVTEKRNAFKAWTVLLAVCAFSLSLLGTFLVRSGVLISVHAFAVDPKRGAFILKFLACVIGGSLLLYAWRGRRIVHRANVQLCSREAMLLANNVILFVAMLTVLLGTLYPLIIDALNLGKLSVGAPYFNAVLSPLMVPLLFLMGVAPHFNWQHQNLRQLVKRFFILLLFAILLACILPWLFVGSLNLAVVTGLILAFWVILNTFYFFGVTNGKLTLAGKVLFNKAPMLMAHLGIAVTAIGIVLSVAYSQQRNLNIKIGERVNLGGYVFQLDHVKALQGPNYHGAQAAVAVYKGQRLLTVLHPQQRIYEVEGSALAKVAIDKGLWRDLYVALGQPLPNQQWGLRIYYKPFVRWIWLGGLMMVLGGLLALLNRLRQRRRAV